MAKTPVEERQLNKEQKQAVVFGKGPLLIIAGAGTGKTTVVTERIKYLISSGLARPDQILALTFTEKASHEMEERVDMAMPYGTTQMWISTFHAFCDRILRSEAINIGLDPGYTLMTEAETIHFFRKHIHEFNLTYFRPLGNPMKFISGMIQHFSRLKDEDVTPNQYFDWVNSKIESSVIASEAKQSQKTRRSPRPAERGLAMTEGNKEEKDKYKELAEAYRRYEELKIKEGVADYSDLISNTLKLFRTRKTILSRYQKQFKYLLIDEFQDTNFAQNELAILLAGSRKNITVVGDDDQAIYRWRGAAISNIIQFRKRFPKAKIIVLTKNYRSTKEILDRSYDFIQHNNPDRLEVAEKIDKKLESMRMIEGEKIKVIYTERVEDEAEEVAAQVKSQKSKVKSDGEKYEWKDFAILVRANNHAEPFVRALARAGIPYQFLGPGRLYKQPEIKDLIAYLKVLYNFEDNVAMYRVLSMEWLGIEARDIAVLLNHARKYGISLFEICENVLEMKTTEALSSERNFLAPLLARESMQESSSLEESISLNENPSIKLGKRASKISFLAAPRLAISTLEKTRQLVEMIHRHLGLMKKETTGQILYYFLQDTGILEQFATYKNPVDERIAGNIAKFFNKLKTYEGQHDDASVFTVVEWINLAMELGESPLATDTDWSENNAVNILTIHSAKGLEFPAVFLVNLVSQRFPTMERKEQIPIPDGLVKELLPVGDYHMEEERRLFYVGMTRARDELYMTGAKYYGEGKREKKLSPFIEETVGERISNIKYPISNENKQQLSLMEWQKVEIKEPPIVREPVTYLSYSQLSTFNTCPLQYKYRYVLHIPVPQSAALSFGDSMHKTVRAFYELAKNGTTPSKDTLVRLLDDYWIPLGYGNRAYEDKMKSHGRDLLSGFYVKGYDVNHLPKDLEYPFKIKITPKLQLGGKIDRVDELKDGIIEIIDYKTGMAPKTRDPGSDAQLTVYALAATDKGIYNKKPEDVIVSFYFFENQEKISGTRTARQLEAMKEEVAQKADEIRTSAFRPAPGKQCDFCEFRLICEAWS